MKKTLDYIFRSLLIFGVYVVLARIGPSIATVNFASAVWIPSGIALTAILLMGYKYWPSIALGELIVNWLLTPLPLDVSLAMTVGDTTETLLTVFLLRHFGFKASLNHLKDVVLLLLVGMLGTAISATVGVSSLYLKGLAPMEYFETWRTWWVANTLSIVIFPPLILTWYKRPSPKLTLKKVLEFVFFSFFLLTVDLVVFRGAFVSYIDPVSTTYLIFPPLIWAALRYGVKGTSLVIFLTGLVSIIETAQGRGPFITGSLAQNLLSLQTFIGAVGATILILSATETERKELELRKDEFINLANHELKTPLTSIKAFSQVLSKTLSGNSEKTREWLRKIDDQIDNMTELIDGLLNVSKIQLGKFTTEKEKFCLDCLIEETVREIKEMHPKNKISVKNNLKRKYNIIADKKQITRVLINLLTNAMKYSSAGSDIIVGIKLLKDKDIEVSVQDFGIGVTKEEKDKIFDKYYRVSSRRNITTSGLGIGLYISDQIIKNHGGKMSVESEKGKGSTFYFSLPV